MIKKLILLLLASTFILSSFTGCGTAAFEYELMYDGSYGVRIVNSTFIDKIVIPDSYNGKPVRHLLESDNIGDYLATEVIIPDSIVETRGLESFVKANEYVDGVNYVGGWAYHADKKQETIVIREGTVGIGSLCDSASVNLRVRLPESVKYIGSSAFWFNESLEYISLPSQIEYIGEDAFSLTHIKELIIPPTIKYLGEHPFSKCHELEKLVLPRELTVLYDNTFNNCDKLAIYYTGTEEEWNNVEFWRSYNQPTERPELPFRVFFYSEEEPQNPEGYWRYLDGHPITWEEYLK